VSEFTVRFPLPLADADLQKDYALASRFPVGAGDLSFDPATQSELNSHVGDADAHHSPPTQTQSVADESVFTSKVPVDADDGQTVTVDVSGMTDAIRLSGSANAAFVVRNVANGNTLFSDDNPSLPKVYDLSGVKLVGGLEVENNGSFNVSAEAQFRVPTVTAAHSHTI
jgi:hypothetical protein